MVKAFLVAESEILDPAALAAYIGPVRRALVAAGGKRAVISSIGRRIPLKAIPATDVGSIERASGEYLRKYRTSPYAQAMVKAETLPTTLKLEPR